MKTIKEKILEELDKRGENNGWFANLVIDLTLKDVVKLIDERISRLKARYKIVEGGVVHSAILEMENLKARIDGK